jgi:hypothetical protein
MRKIAVIAVAGAALVAAGCGGSSYKGLSKADYARQGNAICKAGSVVINAGSKSLGPKSTKAQITQFVTGVLVPSVEGQIKDIRALKAPKADKDNLAKILDEAQGVVDKIKADPALATEGNAFAAVNKKLSAYGLTECGK